MATLGNRNFWLLFAGQNFSAFGDWFRTVTTIGLIYSWTGSTANLSMLFIASMLPMVLVSSFLGPMVDRYSRQKLMVTADLLRVLIGFGFVVLVPLQSPYLLYALLAINGAFSGLYFPARSAFIPEIVEKEKLIRANSFLVTSFSTTMVIATGLGGLVADLFSPQIIYTIDALTFLVSALCMMMIRPAYPHTPAQTASMPYLQQIKEGLQEIKKSPKLQSAVWIMMAREAALSVVYVIFSVYILKLVNQGNFGLGLGHTASGLGQIIGGLSLAAYFKQKQFDASSYRMWSTLSLMLLGFLHAFSYQQDMFWLFLAIVVVANVFYSPIDVLSSTSIMTYSSPETRGRIFAASLSLSRLFYVGGFILIGLIGDSLPVSTVAWGLACFLFVAGLLNGVIASREAQNLQEVAVK